jgi:hypothetical protein
MNNVLKDKNGKESSKRIAGIVIASIGVAMHVVLFAFSIATKIADPATASSTANMMIGTGAALLGVGVLENLGGKNA